MTSAPTDFYPRPPRGGRRLYRHSQADVVNFYPRPPQGGRPLQFPLVRTDDVISIHALREEGDLSGEWTNKKQGNFYPRPPRGGRRQNFQQNTHGFLISIHALREEGDKSACTNLAEAGNFYPRPPRGGRRLQEIDARKKARKFLSTPSARRATYIEYVLLKHLEISIHALREEGDRFFR